MSNYRGSLNLEDSNNNWTMAFDLIKPGSKVLDVGCSSGNFGEALIRMKQCVVEGVEPDPGDSKIAKRKLSKVYTSSIERVVGDFTSKDKYDYIVFLDVIEHLENPTQVLSLLKPHLKADGSIIFSIPNMGHQSVRIMLLGGDFEYGETGILDNTHLHFYTEKEINRVFNGAGYNINKLQAVSVAYDKDLLTKELSKVGVKNPDHTLLNVLNSNNAHVYQYVGAASLSTSTRHKMLERKFQSPEAKLVIKAQYEARLKQYEAIVAKYEQRIIDLDSKCAELQSKSNHWQRTYTNMIRSRTYKVSKMLGLSARVYRNTRDSVKGWMRTVVYKVYMNKPPKAVQSFNSRYKGNGDYKISIKRLAEVNDAIDWDRLTLSHKDNESKKVSIIVLVFNNFKLTERCVNSIYATKNRTDFELIVVNNGSSLKVTRQLRKLKNKYKTMRLVEIDKNTNFAVGNNIGFSFATGQYSVFLNNDTYVTDGWLDGLLGSIKEKNNKVVQPLLLYPDGAVQNMGIVFSKKSKLGYPIYANTSSKNSRTVKPRRLQAVTGACMLVESRDFAELKGFDPIFINGQEDVDFCLRLKVKDGSSEGVGYCEVNSIVYHDESKTSGRGRYVMENRKAFVDRWSSQVTPDDEKFYNEDGYKVAGWATDRNTATSEEVAIYNPVIKLASASELDINLIRFLNGRN